MRKSIFLERKKRVKPQLFFATGRKACHFNNCPDALNKAFTDTGTGFCFCYPTYSAIKQQQQLYMLYDHFNRAAVG